MSPAVSSNLLGAARAFIRQSAGAAALTILPLAAVELATPAQAQITAVNFTSGGTGISGGNPFTSGVSYFDYALNPAAHIVGGSATFGTSASGGGSVTAFMKFDGTGSGTFTGTFPIAYDFVLGTSGSATNLAWSLAFDTGLATSQVIASGTGGGQISGLGNYARNIGSFTYYHATLTLTFDTGNPSGSAALTMNSASQGLALNATAIPEPATTVGWFALIAGLWAAHRRTRFRRAAA
jgi:hypothetical protein